MTIEFWLDGTSSDKTSHTLTYVPFGTRSIRLRVRSNTPLPTLVLRPHTLAADKAAGLFRGYEDGVEEASQANFEISWGGGQEAGPCAKSEDRLGAFEQCVEFAAGDQRTIIFNLTHLTNKPPEKAAVTFNAYHGDEIQASLTINLVAPNPLPTDIQRFIEMDDGHWIVPSGSYLPNYLTRWWPDDQVVFEEIGSPPPITIKHDPATTMLTVMWNHTVVARIEDHTNPTILDTHYVRPELYHFDEYYYAVRIWFFWLDVNIGHGFFIGRHEVPDAERFDLLIRKQDGKVGLACTDLHWRESWGVALETPIVATIGLTREAKVRLARDQISSLWTKIWGKATPEEERMYNPIEFVRRRAKREARYDNFVVRGKGTEAHLPMLENVEAEERMTSSDVRRG